MYWNLEFKKFWRIALLVVVPFLAIRIQESPPYTQWFDKPFSFLISHVQDSVGTILKVTYGFINSYIMLIEVQKKNEEYKYIIEALQVQKAQFDQLNYEIKELRALLNLKKMSGINLLAAESITNARDLMARTFWINRGSSDGIQIGQAVLSKDTLIGSIIRVLSSKSQVLLLNDRFSVIDAMILRTQAKGILEGRNSDEAIFKSFEKVHDIQVDDQLVSTGIDQIFPRGIKVGKVVRIEKDLNTGLNIAFIKLEFDLAKLHYVFVAINKSDQDHSFWNEQEVKQ